MVTRKEFFSNFCIEGATRPTRLDEVWELDIDAGLADPNNTQWTAAPPMSTARSSFTCNLITTSGGEDEIVVVAGSGASSGVEIFSVNNRVWRAGELASTSIGYTCIHLPASIAI